MPRYGQSGGSPRRFNALRVLMFDSTRPRGLIIWRDGNHRSFLPQISGLLLIR